MSAESLIYKIESAPVWAEAEAAGVYEGSAVDKKDGYIHFSTRAQVEATLAKWFAGQRSLVLAAIDPLALGDALRYEAARGGDLFPHLYAVLPMRAVRYTRNILDCADDSHEIGTL